MDYRIGIDLGGTNIKAGIVDKQNKLVSTHSCPTLVDRSPKEIIADMADACEKVAKNIGIKVSDCLSCGIGSPGTVDATSGEVIYSNNFSWKHIPLGKQMRELLHMPVKVTNDANCAALGEFVAGAAKFAKSTVLLTLGTGVGSGIVIDGKIFEGGGPGGAELGHSILFHGGELCTCGRKGCIEAYCSATALIREAKKAAQKNPLSILNKLCKDLNNMNGLIPFQAAQAGDQTAQCVIDNYIIWLSEAIIDVSNIFRPEIILLSGGVCAQDEYLTNPLNERVKEKSFGGTLVNTPLVARATLGNDAGIIGAANL